MSSSQKKLAFNSCWTSFSYFLFENCVYCHLKCTDLSLPLNQKLNNILVVQVCPGFVSVFVWNSSLTKKQAAAAAAAAASSSSSGSQQTQSWGSVLECVRAFCRSKNLIRKRRASFQIVICRCHLSHMQTCGRPGVRADSPDSHVQTRQPFETWTTDQTRSGRRTPRARGPYLPSPDESHCFNENRLFPRRRRQPNAIQFCFNARDKMGTDWKGRFVFE